MKREYDGFDEERMVGNKRNNTTTIGGHNEALAEGKFELRLLLPTKAVGAVIGKGGETIKELRLKYDAHITVPDRGMPERVLTINCAQANLPNCVEEVLDKLAEEQPSPDGMEVRLLVHQQHAGAIIGKEGSKIKELREATGTQMKVYQKCCPQSTDRIVFFSGQKCKLRSAIMTTMELLREIPINIDAPIRPYDSANHDPHNIHAYGGFAGAVWLHGGGTNVAGVSYAGGFGGMPGTLLGGAMEQLSTTQVTIPNELAGTIIGKGGERIKRIRSESGARIDIGDATGAGERVINIAGTPHQIQAAHYLLQQCVRVSEAGRAYLRGEPGH